ncbi:MAG: class I SAM-dependent methyltransferase [Pyrinomonadaceae bacterium]
MLDKMLELGMERNSDVMELGCGIGIITSLLAKVVKEGRIRSMDISPKSVEIAKQNAPAENIVFEVGDVAELPIEDHRYDFVTLFDVLEHVPVKSHPALMKVIKEHLKPDGRLVINIPTARILRYLHEHTPEVLQIIDQPVETSEIVANAENAGLRMVAFEEYGIWREEETRFMVFEVNGEFTLREREAMKPSIKRRIQNKFEIYW